MKPEEFTALRKAAAELYALQPAKEPKVTLDAIFVAMVNTRTIAVRKSQARQSTEEEIPKWFHDTLAELAKTGEEVTIGKFLILANQFPATRTDSFKVARWLRDAHVPQRKTGGNLIFGPVKPAKPAKSAKKA